LPQTQVRVNLIQQRPLAIGKHKLTGSSKVINMFSAARPFRLGLPSVEVDEARS